MLRQSSTLKQSFGWHTVPLHGRLQYGAEGSSVQKRHQILAKECWPTPYLMYYRHCTLRILVLCCVKAHMKYAQFEVVKWNVELCRRTHTEQLPQNQCYPCAMLIGQEMQWPKWLQASQQAPHSRDFQQVGIKNSHQLLHKMLIAHLSNFTLSKPHDSQNCRVSSRKIRLNISAESQH